MADLLSATLQLPTSNGVALSPARRDKFAMREALRKAGLSTPSYLNSDNLSETIAWINRETHYPVVLKPLKSGGTEDVFICADESEVVTAFNTIMGKINSFKIKNTSVLVESFLEGREYVVNSVSCNGQHMTNDIRVYHKKYIKGHGNIYDREELLDFEGETRSVLIEYVHKVLNALSIKFGPSHAEIIMTKQGPVLVEIGARISGGTDVSVSQECVGHDAVNLTLDSYVDPDNFFTRCKEQSSVKKYTILVDIISEQEGLIEEVRIADMVAELPSFRRIVVKVSPGDYLTKTVDLDSSPVKIHLVHEDPQQIERDYQRILELVKSAFTLSARQPSSSKFMV